LIVALVVLLLRFLLSFKVCCYGCCCLTYAADTALAVTAFAVPITTVLLMPLLLLLTVVTIVAIIASHQLIVASFPIDFLIFCLQSLHPCQGCSHCLLSPSLLMLLVVPQCCQRQLQLAVIIVSCRLIVTACLMVLLQPVIAVLPMILLLVLYLSDLHSGPCLATDHVCNWG